ncbi:MAG: glycosyltransferase [Acidimicrobiales bacterium]
MLRVALDLDGALEPFGETMVDLASALAAAGDCELVRFRSWSAPTDADVRLGGRWWWRRWWRAGRGWPLDRWLAGADVVHVAGPTVPPTREIPLVISVEDLRPLREEGARGDRGERLRRALSRGALIATSNSTARLEVAQVLGVSLDRVVAVPPPVPALPVSVGAAGSPALVVHVAGATRQYLAVADGLLALARERGLAMIVLSSAEVAELVGGGPVLVRNRREGTAQLAAARVLVHLADGARFPSLPLAALGAGIPVVTPADPVTRELLGGAAFLTSSLDEIVPTTAAALDDPAQRAIARAAGPVRAADFHPTRAASAYLELYAQVVRDWTP